MKLNKNKILFVKKEIRFHLQFNSTKMFIERTVKNLSKKFMIN